MVTEISVTSLYVKMHILGFQAVLVTRSGYRKLCNITICIFIPDIHVLKMKMYSNVHFEVCEAVLSKLAVFFMESELVSSFFVLGKGETESF